MPRSFPGFIALALSGVLLLPSAATAQVRISLSWNGFQSGGPHLYAEVGTGGAYVVGSFGHPSARYRGPRSRGPVHLGRGVRIPPGHLPGPGMCRLWYPGRPPGHQPRPFRCSDRYHDPYTSGYGYGSGYGAGPQVYPRPEYGPRGGYHEPVRYEPPRYDEPRYQPPRYDEPSDYGPVRGAPRYLEDPRDDGYRGVDAVTGALSRARSVGPTADAATERRWEALGGQARRLRQELAGAGRAGGR